MLEWADIYASRQNHSILNSEVIGVEEVSLSGEKVPCLVVGQRIKGIIPLKETTVEPGPNKNITRARLSNLIGQEVAFVVIAIDRENDLFVASCSEAANKMASRTWAHLEEGQEKEAIVRRYVRVSDPKPVNLGIVVEIDGVEAFLPVQEISHGWVNDLSVVPLGEKIKVKIVSIDREKQKITVSLKALLPDPWPGCVKKYLKRGTYMGTVTGIAEYGVFVSFEPGVNCLCRHPKAGRVEKNDRVAVTVTSVNPEERKINGFIVRVVRKSVFSAV